MEKETKKKTTKKKETSKTNTKRKTTNRISNKNVDKKVEEEKIVEEVVTKKEDKATSFNLVEVIIIMIITAIFGILVGAGATYFKDNVIDKNTVPSGFEEFFEVYNELYDDYYKNVDKDALIEAGIKGMVEVLGDPNSSYLDSGLTDDFNEELEGEFVGIGATVTLNDNNNIIVVDLVKDKPAEKAGLKVNDYITEVNGKNTSGMMPAEVSELIKGEKGTYVEITYVRDEKVGTLKVKRDTIEIQSVYSNLTANEKIGYVRIDVFAKNTPEQFERAMDDLLAQKVESVIIDVRCNSGGYLTSAQEIASSLLDKNDVIYQLDTKGLIEKVINEKDKKYDVKFAVLIDGGSASASEILASTLKDNLNIPLVGAKSFGKGTVQNARKLSSGAMIKYTIQEWYTANGNRVDGVGLKPDYEVEQSEEYYKTGDINLDAQYQKAIEVLSK